MRRVTSRQNGVVESYRDAARGDSPLLLLDGEHLVGEALDAGHRLTHLAVALERTADPQIARLIADAERQGTEVIEASAPVMDAVSPVRSSSAMVALAERPEAQARVFARTPALVVVACDVQDPGNLGAMIRAAEGAGATGFIAAGTSADPFGWKALRGSMGSALRLPIARRQDLSAAITDARAHGCRIVATVPRDGAPFYDADLRQPSALLIGGEGRGLPAAVVADADERVTIPMTAPVESLNAAIATALVAYEARRQRS